MYESSVKQDLNNNKGGYVSINFIENKNKKELYESYLINTLKVINECRERGFRYFDQAILVRNKNQQKLYMNSNLFGLRNAIIYGQNSCQQA